MFFRERRAAADVPSPRRADLGKAHQKEHDKIVSSIGGYLRKVDAVHILAGKKCVGGRWISTLPDGWPDITVTELCKRNRRWLGVEVKVAPDTLSEAQEIMHKKLTARHLTCVALPLRRATPACRAHPTAAS